MSTLAPVRREGKAVRPWFRFDPMTTVREEMEGLMNRAFGEEGWTITMPKTEKATAKKIEVKV